MIGGQSTYRGRREVMAKLAQKISLFDLPGDITMIHPPHTGNQQGSAQGAAGQFPGNHLDIRLARQYRFNITIKNAAILAMILIRLLGQVWFRIKNPRGFDHRFFEGEMLKGMKRIVMNEYSYGPLGRKVVQRVLQCMPQHDTGRLMLLRMETAFARAIAMVLGVIHCGASIVGRNTNHSYPLGRVY